MNEWTNAYLLLSIQFLQNYLLPTVALLYKPFFFLLQRNYFCCHCDAYYPTARASGKHDASDTREHGDKQSVIQFFKRPSISWYSFLERWGSVPSSSIWAKGWLHWLTGYNVNRASWLPPLLSCASFGPCCLSPSQSQKPVTWFLTARASGKHGSADTQEHGDKT